MSDPASDQMIAALVARRRRIREWWNGADRWSEAEGASPPIGLALSGGGIRSATFSLGLLQGLAKSSRDALSKVDVLSTVSGGGYAGCFFRSLFVPTSLRSIDRANAPEAGTIDGQIADQYRLAREALESGPDKRVIDWRPTGAAKRDTVRNPLWWLREHSRYLAPTGPTDYGFALAYLARNWLAMIYLFVLACVSLAVLIVMLEALAVGWTGWPSALPVSPLVLLTLLPLAASAALSIAYWATQAMSTNEPLVARQRESLSKAVLAIVTGAVAAVVLVEGVLAVGSSRWGLTTLAAPPLGAGLGWLVGAGLVASLTGATIAIVAGRHMVDRGSMLTAELRLALTDALATAGRVLAIVAALALIDSLGASLARLVRAVQSPGTFWTAAIFPALAVLIKKLPDWFGGTGGGTIGGIVKRFASTVALVVGLILYGLLAIGAVALVHHVAWDGAPWQGTPRWPGLIILAGLAWILALISGRATGFINLSSLHSLYSARLIRAYLGASNLERLKLATKESHPKPITENHPCDYIQPRVYGETDLPAPIHIINVTLNETIDPASQIVARDRKGDILSLEPGGIRIGDDLIDWSRLTNTPPVEGRNHAEGISLGQWCAVSGAAASSAMGRMTNLGYAIAFTFANIRLGYWWWAPDVCKDMPSVTGWRATLSRHFGTFVYLWNEMTCRYSRGYARKYLTDGGHYENSGAYALIRRGVPLMLVSDNGADPGYGFEDLQTLIRQVRIDLGSESTILGHDELVAFLAAFGVADSSIFVDPKTRPDWQQAMTDPAYPAFVLVVRVSLGDRPLHLLWVKPRLLPDLPADLAGYAALTKTFPQQPTGDQFFDEAQWESYRRLGEESITRLLDACPGLLRTAAFA